jgi:hypothetical protein
MNRVPRDELSKVKLLNYGGPFFRDHTVFPYRSRQGEVVQMQGRALDTLTTEARWKGMPTKSEVGNCNITTLVWGEELIPKYRQIIGPFGKTYTFLCEGATDAITLRQAGLHAVSMIGNKDIHRLSWKFRNFDTVYLVLDNDLASQQNLITELYEFKVMQPLIDLRVITLPNESGVDKKGNPAKQDINSFFVNLGAGAVREFKYITQKAPSALDLIIQAWGNSLVKYEPLLRLISVETGAARTNLIRRLAEYGHFTYSELEAASRIIRVLN